MPHSISFPQPPGQQSLARSLPQDTAHQASRAFETVLLSQMLQSAGVNRPAQAFGGGIGEEQFASFLTEMQAAAMVNKGGLGLAQHLFQMMAKQGANNAH